MANARPVSVEAATKNGEMPRSREVANEKAALSTSKTPLELFLPCGYCLAGTGQPGSFPSSLGNWAHEWLVKSQVHRWMENGKHEEQGRAR